MYVPDVVDTVGLIKDALTLKDFTGLRLEIHMKDEVSGVRAEREL